MHLLNKVNASRLGAAKVCVYVTDHAPPCDLDVSPSPPPSEKRVTQDARVKTCNLALGLLLSPTIIKLFFPGSGEFSYRQPESGGSPISFVHISPIFSTESLLPQGKACPVQVLLRLDSTEATELKGLKVDANNFLQSGLCISHMSKVTCAECVYEILALHSQNNAFYCSYRGFNIPCHNK